MMTTKIYLAIRIIDGKAEVSQISERYFNNFSWRLKMEKLAKESNSEVYFTETEIYIKEN